MRRGPSADAVAAWWEPLRNLKHNQVLHDRVLLVTVVGDTTPRVADEERLEYAALGAGFHRLRLHFGFLETPDIPAALAGCARFGHRFDEMTTTYYLSREVVVPSPRAGMALWREKLFLFIQRNAAPAHEFFRIPTNRVVELGTLLEI